MRLSDLTSVFPFEIVRDGTFDSVGLASHDSPRMLVCLYDGKILQRELLPNRQVACVITTPELAPKLPDTAGVAVTTDPLSCFFEVHEHLAHRTEFYWKDFATEIAPGAAVHPSSSVAARNVRIGRGTTVEANVTIRERSLVGECVTLRAGCVIGAEGFEHKRIGDAVRGMTHAGGVRLADHVEVQSNSVVCQRLFGGFTEVGEHTKISSLVNVSHDVRIGRRCRIAASAALMGGAVVGDDVWIGPHATISNQIRVGDGARVSLGAVVVRDVPAGRTVSGNFAIDHRKFLASFRGSLE